MEMGKWIHLKMEKENAKDVKDENVGRYPFPLRILISHFRMFPMFPISISPFPFSIFGGKQSAGPPFPFESVKWARPIFLHTTRTEEILFCLNRVKNLANGPTRRNPDRLIVSAVG